MIKYLSENITNYFYTNEIISKEEKEIYVYGLHLIFSSVIGIAIILALGVLLNNLVNTVLFLSAFISVRMYSGGYHANSYIKCNMTLITIYLITMAAVNFIPREIIGTSSAVLIALTIYIVLKYAPVDNENKKLTKKQKVKNKRITLFLLSVFYILSLVLYSFNIKFFYTIIITLFLIASLILIRIKGGENNEKHKKNDAQICS